MRTNPEQSGGSGRLNLLLTYAGWHPESWVDRLPRLLEPMGISSHRASSGREATQLIQSVRIHVAVVDLGLPLNTPTAQHEPELDSIEPADLAEGGPRLLELLTRLEARPPVVAVKRTRTQRDETRDIAQSLRLGAFAVVDRPRDTEGLNVMLGVLKRCLERHYAGRWPGIG